ncbi:MAG: flagellar motor protein MotB [Rhodospirillales bacterium]|nr:flagellar motor protein MotB [Rhodospirillales bacterium]
MPPPNPQEEPIDESWMATFADMVTLLMAFFVMLLNFSKIDIPKFNEVAAGIANEIGMGQKEANPIATMKEALEDVVAEMQADQVVDVQTSDKGITIELASAAFYKSGSAEFRPQAIPVLEKVGQLLIAPRFMAYQVEIAGHTDDDPIHTAMYPSNWELSTGRATQIVRYFITLGMDYRRLKAAGFADTRPKYPNRDKDGNPIVENQLENRRIVIDTTPMSLEERAMIFGNASYGLAEQKVIADERAAKEEVKKDEPDPSTLTGLPKKTE